MKRFAIAAILAAALGQSAVAQPAPGAAPPPAPALPPAAELPQVYVPPGPAIPIYKSGGVVVGTDGYYPYDTGNWLLGGADGTTRQSGSFTMVFPGGAPGIAPVAGRGHPIFKHGLFRR